MSNIIYNKTTRYKNKKTNRYITKEQAELLDKNDYIIYPPRSVEIRKQTDKSGYTILKPYYSKKEKRLKSLKFIVFTILIVLITSIVIYLGLILLNKLIKIL